MTAGPASLAEALLTLQADLPTVAKRQTAKVETTKGSYSYKYAGLQAVSSAILPRLNQLGLVFIARPTLVDGRPVLLCELIHVATGERLPAEYPIAVAPNAPAQAIGSAISYGRRYCLCAMVGAVAEEDDDGRAASMRYDEPVRDRTRSDVEIPADLREPRERRPRNAQRAEPDPAGGPRMISEPQSKKLHTILGKAGHTDREAKLAYCTAAIGRDITSSNDLTFREAAQIISSIENALSEGYDEGGPA